MKAYVIKNKKGEYLDNCQDFETNNICDARLFDDYKEALSFSPKNCEVIQITIAGGDLQKEKEELNEALYWACNYITRIVDKDVNKLPHEWADYFIQQAKEQRDEEGE